VTYVSSGLKSQTINLPSAFHKVNVWSLEGIGRWCICYSKTPSAGTAGLGVDSLVLGMEWEDRGGSVSQVSCSCGSGGGLCARRKQEKGRK
jgi:hypothetical protein